MAIDAKKHNIPAPGEAPTRAALALGFLSINDVVPVANATEQAQLKSNLASTAYPIAATRPAVSIRSDAPALHAIEYSGNGDVWLPASGVLHFASDAVRNAWTNANSALLTVGDHCISAGFDGVWNGSMWIQDTTWTDATLNNNWTTYAGETPRYKVRGGIVFLAGRVSGSSAANPQIFQMPTGLRASVGYSLTYQAHSDNGTQVMQVGGDGNVVCASNLGTGNRTGISLASISYPVG
ncbi:hypothetical protein [uncultured Microbacterium sp.]|uniref:hypothetical protein n=1 Tax=uncultured Microbacterium sp. TaxID=191216 RepID=UPI0025DD6FDA|nr:hypothetical protein [uncultured Microbacterium sp.]